MLIQATSELNGLIDDDEAEGRGDRPPDGYVSISRQRLARVASACNSTIMKLTSIAEEKEGGHFGDDDSSSGGNCHFQVITLPSTRLCTPLTLFLLIYLYRHFQEYGYITSDRAQLSSSNNQSSSSTPSWGRAGGRGAGLGGIHRLRPQQPNHYRHSDDIMGAGSPVQGCRDGQIEVYHNDGDDSIVGNDDASRGGGVNMVRLEYDSRPQSGQSLPTHLNMNPSYGLPSPSPPLYKLSQYMYLY